MSRTDVALALAAFFTFGCITIHEARVHARAMTVPLSIDVACLGLLAGLTTLSRHADAFDRTTFAWSAAALSR